MSTSKNNQSGDAAGKHVSFTPAHHEDTKATLPTGQSSGDNARSQQAQNSASQQPAGRTSAQEQDNQSNGLEAKAKGWINQQQWLQNIDVNQLSKQAKDLSSKAVEQVNRLTPTQKVVGGALLVSGLSWLALRAKSSASSSSAFNQDDLESSEPWKRSSESVYRGHKTDA